jgi:hypothetical protein
MKRIIYLKYIFFAAIFTSTSLAQLAAQGSIEARVSADVSEMLIGDQANLTISVSHTPNIEVQWPLWADSLAGFEVVSRTEVESTPSDNRILEYKQITLTTFDSGFYRIPALSIPYSEEGSTDLKRALTQPVSIRVLPIVVDTTQDIKAIKGIIGEPLTFWDVFPYILLGLLLVGAGVAIWYYTRKKEGEPEVVAKPKPKIPAHEIAMRKLAGLEAQRLWQKGDIKAYYIELTDILREYMEGRFSIAALESTTDEIVRDMESLNLKSIQIRTIRELLEMADLAKFAKYKPDQGDNLQSMDVVRTFVKETKSWKVEGPEAETQRTTQSETISESK